VRESFQPSIADGLAATGTTINTTINTTIEMIGLDSGQRSFGGL
jgi:hypothetical protein